MAPARYWQRNAAFAWRWMRPGRGLIEPNTAVRSAERDRELACLPRLFVRGKGCKYLGSSALCRLSPQETTTNWSLFPDTDALPRNHLRENATFWSEFSVNVARR